MSGVAIGSNGKGGGGSAVSGSTGSANGGSIENDGYVTVNGCKSSKYVLLA